MSPEELAKHWNVSLSEVQRISGFINSCYSVGIVPRTEDFCDVWKVILYAYDPRNKYVLMEDEGSYSDKVQAIIHGSRWAQNIKMTSGQAKNMGVPADAFLSLKPIEGYEGARKTFLSAFKKKKNVRQRS